MSSILGLPVPSEAQTLKLYQKNLYSNVLPSDEAQQIIIVGDTSTGKSTTINFLLGFPINFEDPDIGTRRPCAIELVKDVTCKQVMYEVHFPKAKDPIIRKQTEDVTEVADMVSMANNPTKCPWYFECLVENPDLRLNHAFDSMPIQVTIKHESFQYPLRLVDLPGLTRQSEGPMEIAKKYIQPGNICILVMGTDNPANGGFPMLAERMCNCSQVLFVQNYASKALEGMNAEMNMKAIQGILDEEAAQGNENARNMRKEGPKFYLTDYGLPCNDTFKRKGVWKEGRDQKNWVEIATNEGAEAVQTAMYAQAGMWAQMLLDAPANQNFFREFNLGTGIKDILRQIIEFQFDGIDQKLIQYKKRVEELKATTKKEMETLKEVVSVMDNPPQWQNLLSKAALTVSEYLDTTIAIPEEGDGPLEGDLREVAKCRAKTKDEGKIREDITKEEEELDEKMFGSKRGWFDEKVDDDICKMLQTYVGFEYDVELACLKSWYRLLDELTGMLAFQPMECISNMSKVQASAGITQGATDRANQVEVMVRLVSILGASKQVGVKDLLCHFVRRLKKLARRDLKNAMVFVKEDKYNAMNEFLDLIGKNNKEMKEIIYKDIENVIMMHMNETFKTWMLGEPMTDESGKALQDRFGAPKIKPGSGMCVPTQALSGSDVMHWLLPFKGHYFNGQIPFKDLELSEDLGGGGGGGTAAPGQVDPELLGEIAKANSQINACNVINMNMYRLCTENYDVKLTVRSSEIEFSLEAMKLLKAMQGEIANFWSSSYIAFLQELKSSGTILSYCKNKMKKDLKAAGMWMQAQDVESYAAAFFGEDMALSYTAAKLEKESMRADSDGLALTTQQEIENTQRELDRNILDTLPGRELQWPGCPMAAFMSFINKSSDPTRVASGDDVFPDNAGVEIYGDAAWRRVCQEFIYVILQLAMKEVSAVELSLAKASRGKQLMESPQDIVAKLVLHRLANLGQSGGVIFKYRMQFVYMKMVKANFFDWKSKMGFSEDKFPAVGEIGGEKWLMDAMTSYAEMNLNILLGQLSNKFAELQPFDWTTLNGRFPFDASKPIREVHYTLSSSSVGNTATKEPAEKNKSQLEEFWTQPLKYRWENLYTEGAYKVVKNEELGGLELDPLTNTAAYDSLSNNACNVAIMNAMECRGDTQQNGDSKLAGEAFHEMALRVHKSMCANAIDYCRPRIKTMMSQVYQEEHLRVALQGSRNLQYKERFSSCVDDKIKELAEVSQKYSSLEETLDIISKNKIASGDKEVKISDEAAKKRADKALADAEEKSNQLATDLALLESQETDAKQSLEQLQKTNTDYTKTLKKYMALEQLSSWALSLDKVSVNKIPKEFENDKFQISAFYFQMPWMGRDIHLVNLPAKVLPYQWIVHSGEIAWSSNLDFTPDTLYEQVTTNSSLSGGVKLPMVFPPGEHFLAIELKRVHLTGKKGFFGNNQTENVEVLCTVVIPFAYALRDKEAWNDLEQAKAWQKFHSTDSLRQNCFDQIMRTGEGATNKTYMFKFEQAMGHYGMTQNEAIKGMEMEVIISQTQEKAATSASSYSVPQTATRGAYAPSAATSSSYEVGAKVEYLSASQNKWFPTEITKVNGDGTFEVGVKKGVAVTSSSLRRPR